MDGVGDEMSGNRGGGSKNTLISLALLMLVGLAGCSSIPQPSPMVGSLVEKDESFKRLWGLYTSCRSNRDPVGAWRDARGLEELARTTAAATSGLGLPAPLNWLVSQPPVRLSVDPRAMAAACLLHAAELSQAVGWEHAAVMFGTLIRQYPETDYAYYVAQARSGLAMSAWHEQFPSLRRVSSP
jgi:hypothetical protein